MRKYATDQGQNPTLNPAVRRYQTPKQEPAEIAPLQQDPDAWAEGLGQGEIPLKSQEHGSFKFPSVNEKGVFQGAYSLRYPDGRGRIVVLRTTTNKDIDTDVSVYDVDPAAREERKERLGRFYRVIAVGGTSQLYLEDRGDKMGCSGMAGEATRILEEDAVTKGTNHMRVLAEDRYIAMLQSRGFSLEDTTPTTKGKRLMTKTLEETGGTDVGTHHNFRVMTGDGEHMITKAIAGK
ncbi:MAG: hypothetical protein GF416_07500 [Candidatus Altiarchaeales archaeon]|nr:hypothetical protein [Candidatus Altiarchaeales archaeon]MBD3416957.1 hypothetical protein [Candidatus Altiarchaeales archaeon]